MISKRMIEKIDPNIQIESVTLIENAEHPLESYDCILSDYKMPPINGIELAETIRNDSDIPIILYTGQGSEEVAEAAFEVGIDDYIRKEFEVAHFQVVARRICVAAERQRAIKDLRRSEKSLAEAQRIANLGNWDWDIVKNELNWSDEIYRIFGLEPQEFGATYEAFMDRVHPDDREYVDQSVKKALERSMDYSIDHRIVLPDGRIRVVHEQAEITWDKGGVPIRMIGAVQDITERKLMEERLMESEERFRGITDNSLDAIFTLDLQGIVTYISPAVETILGEKVENVAGHSFYDLMPEWNHPKAQGQFMGLMSSERVEDVEFDVVRRDGSRCTVEIVASPVFLDGRVVRIQGFLRDVTERKQLREEIRRLNELLGDSDEGVFVSDQLTYVKP
jgi:PAS domain S-box-containing protein